MNEAGAGCLQGHGPLSRDGMVASEFAQLFLVSVLLDP